MLVLTRKRDQSIIIDDNIEITVLEIKGDQIRIGINAPKEVTILRKEVYQEVQAENNEALLSIKEGELISLEKLNNIIQKN